MHVAVAPHAGAGRAAPLLAVARELDARGARVSLAGTGPDDSIVDHECVSADADTADAWGRCTGTGGRPDGVGRVHGVARWLRREQPAALVTDDTFAAMAAPLARVPLYVCTHDVPAIHDAAGDRARAWAAAAYRVAAARAVFFPAVWPPGDMDPIGVSRVPPLALDCGAAAVGDPDVVVPHTRSAELAAAAASLRETGRRVTVVDEEGVAALLPTVRAATLVVCSDYATVMAAAVAGTPALIYPRTVEQRGVARLARRATGFCAVTSPGEVGAAAADPPDPPAFENGVGVVADAVLS